MPPPPHGLRPGAMRAVLVRFATRGGLEVALAALVFICSRVVASVTHGDGDSPVSPVLDLVSCLGAAAAGRWPKVGGIGVGVALSSWLLFPKIMPSLALSVMFVPVLTVISKGLNRLGLVLTAWYLAIAFGTVVAPLSSDLPSMAGSFLLFLVSCAAAWAIGRALYVADRNITEARHEHSQALETQRVTIARDLHDGVASSLARVIMRAEQAKLRGIGDPLLARDMDFIVETTREGSRDLRSMLGRLRDAEVPTLMDPSPWRVGSLVSVIDERVEALRREGFTVEKVVSLDEAALPPLVRESAGKVLVEAISNVAKHADRRAPCKILVEQTGSELEAVVANGYANHGARPTGGPQGGSLGLIGARERVEALGGEFEAGMGHNSWILRIAIPYERAT